MMTPTCSFQRATHRAISHLTRLTHTLLAGFSVFVLPGQTLAFAQAAEPAAKRPNILVILFDDVGFSDFGCYGSPIATPAIAAPHASKSAVRS